MSFLSVSFFLFLVVSLLLYYLLPKKFQWMVLAVGSVVFYLFAGPKYIFYVLATALSTYVCSLLIERERRVRDPLEAQLKSFEGTKDEKAALKERIGKSAKIIRLYIGLALSVDLGILIVIKYLDFLIGNVNSVIGLFGGAPLGTFGFIMPLGLSYYTFSAIGYLLESTRTKDPGVSVEHNFAKFFLYLTYFPHILQGPIPKYNELAPQFFRPHAFDPAAIRSGLQLALWGAFKKLVIADALGGLVASTVDGFAEMTGLRIWAGMIVWGVQLYTDFSGGIDMSRGISECFGITLAENFRRPYFATSLNNYWDRWHITLSEWLKDYVFFPMSLSEPYKNARKWLKKHVKKNYVTVLLNGVTSLMLFTLVGIWHGANWGEILFGVFNGLVIFASTLLEPLFVPVREKLGMDRFFVWRVFRSLRTFWLITIARVLSRANNISDSFRMLGKMFFRPGFSATISSLAAHAASSALTPYLPALCGCLLLFAVSVTEERGHSVRALLNSRPAVLRISLTVLCIAAIVVFGAYGLGYDPAGFIYGTKY